jgi:hypothetical protein
MAVVKSLRRRTVPCFVRPESAITKREGAARTPEPPRAYPCPSTAVLRRRARGQVRRLTEECARNGRTAWPARSAQRVGAENFAADATGRDAGRARSIASERCRSSFRITESSRAGRIFVTPSISAMHSCLRRARQSSRTRRVRLPTRPGRPLACPKERGASRRRALAAGVSLASTAVAGDFAAPCPAEASRRVHRRKVFASTSTAIQPASESAHLSEARARVERHSITVLARG